MKNCIFLAFLLILLLNPTYSLEEEETHPTLVFFVDYEDQPSKDYVEISLQIQAKDTSLTSAINTAASTVQQISNLAKNFCNQNAKRKGQCKDVVDAGKFKLEPRYQLIRKEPVFMGFTVIHEVTISVKSVENIGQLVDKILTKPGITLKNFEWKAIQEPKTHEDAIAEGMEQGEGLCEQLGLNLGRILSIQQIKGSEAKQQQGAKEEEQQQQQEQDQKVPQATVLRFQVECTKKIKQTKN